MAGVKKFWNRSRELIRLARNLRRFLDDPLTIEQATATVRAGVAQRDQRFLVKLTSAILPNPRNPYRQLLQWAGCEFGDIELMVKTGGLDDTLSKLAAAGVYLTFEEFKRRTSTVRGGKTIEFIDADFEDPTFKVESRGTTSGSSGVAGSMGSSFARTAQWAAHWCIFFAANKVLGDPLILWTPGNAGNIGVQIVCAKFGQPASHWFVSQTMTVATDRLYSEARHWICRRYGGFPPPETVAYHETAPVLESVRRLLDSRGAVSMNTTPSAAVRLSLAAQANSVSLAGLSFLLGAEPLTHARHNAIEASGAKAIPLYGSTEAVWTGGQCPSHQHDDEVHVLRDLNAIVPGSLDDESEDSRLLFTSIGPLTPKVFLNTDIGDRGIIGYRDCDCLYHQLGCVQTIHHIRSADKLTGFGVTIWVSDVFHVLENVLPKKLNALPGDFQLVETRTSEGLPRYLLFVHPRVGELDGRAAAKLFLTELGRQKSYYGSMTAMLEREGVLEVVRRAPIPTSRGKQLPFVRSQHAGM